MAINLDSIEQNELKAGTFKNFNHDDAWHLGILAREEATKRFEGRSIVIDISLISGQVLFHTAIGANTTTDNDEWVNRKKNTVFRFGKSSYYIGQKLDQKQKTLAEAFYIDEKEYARHGGCVPIRLDSFDGVIGALTISGLTQQEDHELAISALSIYNDQQRSTQ